MAAWGLERPAPDAREKPSVFCSLEMPPERPGNHLSSPSEKCHRISSESFGTLHPSLNPLVSGKPRPEVSFPDEVIEDDLHKHL